MKVLGLLGMPGAGKTTALESLESRVDHDFESVQMKNVAAEQFNQMQEEGLDFFPDRIQSKIKEEELTDEATPSGSLGEEIADWVDTVLSVEDSFFAKRAADKISDLEDSEVVVVDGIRSVPDVEYVMDVADEFYLVYLHTPFSTRLERLKQRSREGEEGIDAEYLINRDKQELSWGVDEILSSYDKGYSEYEKEYPVEFFYANHDTIPEFETEFNFFVDQLLGFSNSE